MLVKHRLIDNWKHFFVAFEMLLNMSNNSYSNDDTILAKRPANYFYAVCFESCDTLLFFFFSF